MLRQLSRRAAGRLALGAVFVLGLLAGERLEAQPTLVVLVRHGEKQPTPADDPSLSEAGVARAQALAEALAGAKVAAVIVSPRKRTVETAAPVLQRTGLAPTVIALDAAHVANVAAAVRKATGVVLVVGHSNTIPAIVGALGGPRLPDLCDASYATMFVLTPGTGSAPAQVIRTAYGAADAPLPATCTGMVPR